MNANEIIETMRQYGGGFVQALAACWCAADLVNQRKLYEAFRDTFEHYKAMSELIQAQRDAKGQGA